MTDTKFTCSICNTEEDTSRWNNGKELLKHKMCQSCNHWRLQHELDLSERGQYRYAIIRGIHYTLHEHTDGYFKGFGGRVMEIEFFDGQRVTCDNVWCQGRIPEGRWRDLMPDNAKFISE